MSRSRLHTPPASKTGIVRATQREFQQDWIARSMGPHLDFLVAREQAAIRLRLLQNPTLAETRAAWSRLANPATLNNAAIAFSDEVLSLADDPNNYRPRHHCQAAHEANSRQLVAAGELVVTGEGYYGRPLYVLAGALPAAGEGLS